MPSLKTLYNLNVRMVDQYLRRRYFPLRVYPPSEAFIRSNEYDQIMNKYLPYNGEYGLYEASTQTQNYRYRHHDEAARLGVWRWRSLQEHRDTILEHVTGGKRVIDFGGAGCPLGLGSVVVDRLKKDHAGQPVGFSSITDIEPGVDTVFACHVFEHVENLDEVLGQIHGILRPGGTLIVLVPSYTNAGWHAENHQNKRFGGHVWTMGLSSTTPTPNLPRFMNIDETLAKHFAVEEACYAGDDNIFCLCRKAS